MARDPQPGIHEQIGTVLAEYRKNAGMTQADLAAKLGYGQAYVSKVEAGQLQLDVEAFILYSRAVGCDAVKFFRDLDKQIP